MTPKYNTPTSGSLPTDAALKTQGFVAGDLKFTATDVNHASWQIGHSGDSVPHGYVAAGTIA